jgi:hypothetical protein
VEPADAAMNDHAMDARMTKTLYRLHERYGFTLQNSTSIARRMATAVAEEAAASEPIAKIYSKHTHIIDSLRKKESSNMALQSSLSYRCGGRVKKLVSVCNYIPPCYSQKLCPCLSRTKRCCETKWILVTILVTAQQKGSFYLCLIYDLECCFEF